MNWVQLAARASRTSTPKLQQICPGGGGQVALGECVVGLVGLVGQGAGGPATPTTTTTQTPHMHTHYHYSPTHHQTRRT